MSTKTIANLPDEALTAELARRQEQAETELAERTRHQEAARQEWAAKTWQQRETLEADLVQQGQDAREAFTAAVRAADLAGAFEAWMHERTLRYTQEAARNKAQTAGMHIGAPHAATMPPLRWYEPDFLQRLEAEADDQARALGHAQADELVPDAPAVG